MATESARELSDHARGVAVTTLASLSGIVAAFVSGSVVGTTAAAAGERLSLGVLVALIAVQYPTLRFVLGVDVEGFGAKDHLYVAFMTFTLWFVTYAVLLSSAVSL